MEEHLETVFDRFPRRPQRQPKGHRPTPLESRIHGASRHLLRTSRRMYRLYLFCPKEWTEVGMFEHQGDSLVSMTPVHRRQGWMMGHVHRRKMFLVSLAIRTSCAIVLLCLRTS